MALTKVTYSMIVGAVVNVLDFGAKGDGVTDDTAAIQAALYSNGVTYVKSKDTTISGTALWENDFTVLS